MLITCRVSEKEAPYSSLGGAKRSPEQPAGHNPEAFERTHCPGMLCVAARWAELPARTVCRDV